jgi:hypothetical protein
MAPAKIIMTEAKENISIFSAVQFAYSDLDSKIQLCSFCGWKGR